MPKVFIWLIGRQYLHQISHNRKRCTARFKSKQADSDEDQRLGSYFTLPKPFSFAVFDPGCTFESRIFYLIRPIISLQCVFAIMDVNRHKIETMLQVFSK